MQLNIPTPQQWMTAWVAGKHPFKQLTIDTARAAVISTKEAAQYLSTNELTELLWPVRYAQGEAIDVRKAMVNVLLKAAEDELAPFAERGPVSGTLYGKPKRPWRWRAPKLAVVAAAEPAPGMGHNGGPPLEEAPQMTKAEIPAAELADLLAGCEAGAMVPLFRRREIAAYIVSKCKVYA